jgi:penicillin V acylase-like amidase (Ntn superfamily)
MELGDNFGDWHWRLALHARGKPAMWSPGVNKFGFLSIDGLGFKFLPRDGLPMVTEGTNEKGLSVSANVFQSAVYEEASTSKPRVSWFEVPSFLLGSFANVS